MTRCNRRGAGEPVLLLHGFTLSHHVWHAVVDDLAADFDVAAVTMPGHRGGAPLRVRDVGVSGITDDIERQLDSMGWQTCHIVGNSLGGQISFELARRGRARSIVPINPSGGWKRFSRTEIRIGWGFAMQFPLAATVRLLGERGVSSARLQRPVLRNCSAHLAAVNDMDAADVMRAVSHCRAYLPMLMAGLKDGPLAGLGELTVPATLIISELDTFLRYESCIARIRAELPGHVRYRVLPGVGHIPMIDCPPLVATAIREHIFELTS